MDTPRPTAALYSSHPVALTVLYGDLERFASSQEIVFPGTAGAVVERTNAAGFRFFAHQFYDGQGRRREEYVGGPAGAPDVEACAGALRTRIAEVKALVPSLRLLGREGFNLVDAKTYATLASLHNHGVFAAGAMLVGSHAYGVLLNRLGVRSGAYATEDIDIARKESLALPKMPAPGFLEMLRESGVDFVEVPSLSRRRPPTPFKQAGRSTFHVDLLVPSRDETFPVLPVPELKAHATGLPYLAYLLAESQVANILAREGCCAVRVPLPERFAVHKLIVSRLRTGREARSGKDVLQAAVLSAVLGDLHPGALATAFSAVPRSARKHVRAALPVLRPYLEVRYPRAWEELVAERL